MGHIKGQVKKTASSKHGYEIEVTYKGFATGLKSKEKIPFRIESCFKNCPIKLPKNFKQEYPPVPLSKLLILIMLGYSRRHPKSNLKC